MGINPIWSKIDLMMQIPKQVTDCRVNLEVLKEQLSRYLYHEVPHRELIARVIIAHLSKTEMGISHLIQAMAGIEPTFKYHVGTKVLLSIERLPSWKIDKDKTLELTKTGPVYGYVSGKVKAIDPFIKYPYRCEIIVVSSTGVVEEQEHMYAEEDINLEETIDGLIGPHPPLPF